MISYPRSRREELSNGKSPVWPQAAGIVVTFALALVATIHFTIRVDVTPALIRLEDRQVRIEDWQTLMVERLDGIENRLNRFDQRLERIEAALIKR